MNTTDIAAVNTIKDGCVSVLIDSVTWYDTEELKHCSSVAWEIKYLRHRGLLVHHPMIPKLVRLQE